MAAVETNPEPVVTGIADTRSVRLGRLFQDPSAAEALKRVLPSQGRVAVGAFNASL